MLTWIPSHPETGRLLPWETTGCQKDALIWYFHLDPWRTHTPFLQKRKRVSRHTQFVKPGSGDMCCLEFVEEGGGINKGDRDLTNQ